MTMMTTTTTLKKTRTSASLYSYLDIHFCSCENVLQLIELPLLLLIFLLATIRWSVVPWPTVKQLLGEAKLLFISNN